MAKIENEPLLDHEYDGIQELDNFLPPWWKWLFIITIIFAFAYILHFHVFGTGDSQAVAYYKEMNPEWAESDLKVVGPSYRYTSPYAGQASVAAVAASNSAEISAEPVDIVLLTDNTSLDNGKQIYNVNCVACHGVSGEGLIGPNLTDEYWIHGGSLDEIVHIINVGVPAKGMIAWDKTLSPQQILEVSSFIISLEGTNPSNPKAPEGDLYTRNN